MMIISLSLCKKQDTSTETVYWWLGRYVVVEGVYIGDCNFVQKCV